MAVQGGEIITLQFGHYSNYVGMHWWNLQEAGFSYNVKSSTDINNDVLFREGQTTMGEVTFTPRLVLADLKGSLGTLPEDGGLYDTVNTADTSLALWPENKVKLEVSAPVEKNEFLSDLDHRQMCCEESYDNSRCNLHRKKRYNLDDSIQVWSDYSRLLFHSRSLMITNQYQLNDNERPFNCFGLGTSLWKNHNYQEDFTERIRAYMEEADNSQGFHVLMDSHDGFSGLSCGCLQYLNDEYTTKRILAFLCLPSHYNYINSTNTSMTVQDSIRVANIALSVGNLIDSSSLFCPISNTQEGWRQPEQIRSYSYLNYNPELSYHSSAILAASLETLTSGYRLRNSSSVRLGDLTSGLRVVGRAAVAASITLPFAMAPKRSLLQTLENWDGPLSNSVTPYCDFENIDLQSMVLRGVPNEMLIGDIPAGTDMRNPVYSCRSVGDMLKLFIAHNSYPSSPTSHVSHSVTPLKTHDPFPNIFNEELISQNGQLIEYAQQQNKGVNEVPVLAGLHSTKSISRMLDTLHSEAKRINVKQLHSLIDSGIEVLDWQENLENLLCLSDCYKD